MDPFLPQEQSDHTESKVFHALEKLGELIRSLQWETAKAQQLSPLQLQVLLFLHGHGPQQRTVAYLADEFSVTRPTISDAIKSLMHKGYVVKEKNPADSRSTYLHLTVTGSKLIGQLNGYPHKLLEEIGALPTKKREALLSTLLHLLHSTQRSGLARASRMCFHCAHYDGDHKGKHYCQLFQKPLPEAALRIDCPEFSAPEH